jgi:hypothetical protein
MAKIPKNIRAFYESLDNIKSLNIWNINKEIAFIENIDKKWQSKILTERKILNFNINKGELQLNFQTTNIKGKPQENFSLSQTQIKYLQKRLNESHNSWLLSRYAHILWQETKQNKFAEIAIQHYLENLKSIIPAEVTEFSIIFSAIFLISKKSKQKISEIKDITTEFLNSNSPTWLKCRIIKTILENTIFSREELTIFAGNILIWIENEKTISYSSIKDNLEIAIMLFQRLKLPTEKIYELLAYNEDIILEQHPNDNDFVKYTTIGKKASYLKLAKKTIEYEITMIELTRLKQTIQLKKISVSLDDEDSKIFNDYLNKRSDAILKFSPEMIFAYFCDNESLLVDPEENKERAKETYKNSLRSLVTTSVFDINSNFKKSKNSDGYDLEMLQNYTISHGIKVESLFFKVFVNGIISGKINYYNIYNFLNEHTWYGMKTKRSIASNELDDNSSWITLLSPGIHNLISQFELLVIMNTNKISNFILSIDSLTLKFEGALRDFIRLSGGNTTIEKNSDLKEQLLDELLDNSKIVEYFSDKDIALFKHTFTNKGKNIRNNVAHSFMQFSDYNLQTACLVFFCLLRLGKYTLEPNQ